MIKHFLLVFDHDQGRLIEIQEFGTNGRAAVDAYEARERRWRVNRRIEVVLVGSDSIETVKVTHANYFEGFVARSKYLAGLTS